MTQIGFVYSISNDVNENIYIGSTFQLLKHRFYGHKMSHLNLLALNYNCKFYTEIREIGFDHFKINLLECITECKDKDELHICEQKYIDEYKAKSVPLLNQNRAYITEEGLKENKIRRLLEGTKYRATHRDEIHKRNLGRADKMKEYYKENEEHIVQYKKDHYAKNREEIQRKQKELRDKKSYLVVCECGSELFLKNMTAHKKTKKHIKSIKDI